MRTFTMKKLWPSRATGSEGEPGGYEIVCDRNVPLWPVGAVSQGRGPTSITLLGKPYHLGGVYEALVGLKAEFESVLIDPATGGLRTDA